MAETAEAPVATPVAKKTKNPAAKPKKSKTAPSHPKVSEMVNSAIASLKERGGSSLQAIKKHIASNHKVDVEKLSPFIKKYLRNAVASGSLVQTKGKGATGSFRMSAGSTGKVKPAKKATPVAKSPAKKTKPTAQKPKLAKKSAKPKAAKITKKTKTVKPKTPKPKKAKKTPVKKAPAKKGSKK